ncbi:hypothetical protein AFB00_12595 [Pseudonocardia sp. HH130630-07]|nr:hypothetical protein AFB00_12595 [Pseudonocardia sp. HH130630-07]
MRRLLLAALRAHGRKLLLAGLATFIGTAFVAGTLVVSDTLRANVERTVVAGAARIDVVAAATSRLSPLTGEGLQRIRETGGVRSAEGLVTGDVSVLGDDGRPVREQPAGFSVTVRTDVVAGRAPATDGEVLLAEQTSRVLGKGVGSTVAILDSASGEPRRFVVSGLAGVAGQGDLVLRGGVGMTPGVAARMTGTTGFSEIYVRGDDPAALVPRVAAALDGAPATVTTGREYAEAQAAGSGLDPEVLGTGLLMFALVAMLVAVFVIQNTFTILLGRRTRELALARCVGASRRQVFGSVLAEALVMGAAAAALGTLAGIGAVYAVVPLIQVSGAAVPVSVVTVTPVTVLVASLTGVLATVAAAVLPARAATRVPPVAALRRAVDDRVPAGPPGRTAGGIALGVLGLLCTGFALLSDGRLYPLVLVGVGGALFFGGVVLLGPVVVGPLVAVVGRPLGRLFGVPGRLAVANAARSPARAATTVLALVVGITLTTGVSVITRSLEASVAVGASRLVPADYLVSPPGTGPGSVIARGVYDDLRRDAAVTAVTRVRESRVTTAGGPAQLSTMEGTLTPAAAAALGPGRVALRPERAAELGTGVGGTITVVVDGRPVPLVVDALVTGEAVPRMIVGNAFFESLFPGRGDAAVLAGFAPDLPAGQSRAIVDRATAQDPTVRIVSTLDVRERVAANFGQATALISALLALAVLVSLVGVANTLTLSVLERTRESAMLRALGLAASGLRTMLTAEALVFGVAGGLLGTLLGSGFGIAAARVIDDRVVVDLPWGLMALLVGGVPGWPRSSPRCSRPAGPPGCPSSPRWPTTEPVGSGRHGGGLLVQVRQRPRPHDQHQRQPGQRDRGEHGGAHRHRVVAEQADQRRRRGAQPELQRPEQRRGRPGALPVPGECQCRCVGHHEPAGQQHHPDADEHGGEATGAGRGQDEQDEPGQYARGDPAGQHPARLQVAQQHRVQLGADDQPDRPGPEQQPERPLVDPELLLEDVGGAGDVAEQCAHREPGDEDEADERPVPQQRAVGAQGGAEAGRPAPGRGQRLRQPVADHDQHDQAVRREEQEHPAPGHPGEQPGAERRREHRRGAHDEHQPGQHARRRAAGEQVTDDREPDHRAGRGARALQDAQQGEHLDRGGHRDQRRRDDVQRRPGQQQRATAVRVGQRADQELTQRQPGERAGQGQLDGRPGGAEVAADLGQRGQVGVDGERTERDQRTQDECEPYPARCDDGCGHRSPPRVATPRSNLTRGDRDSAPDPSGR